MIIPSLAYILMIKNAQAHHAFAPADAFSFVTSIPCAIVSICPRRLGNGIKHS
jgi:hypothetical protein